MIVDRKPECFGAARNRCTNAPETDNAEFSSVDTLCGYVWPSEASGSTMRKRRQRVREALPELVALGWTVTEFAAGKYDITRPKAAG